MSPIQLEARAPTSTLPSSGTSSVPTASPSTTTSAPFSVTSWDTRAGSLVHSDWNAPANTSTPTNSHSSGSFLSSKPAVAGLCTGIAVVCLLFAGFLIYRVKWRRPKSAVPSKSSIHSRPSESAGRSSKAPPSPFQIGTRFRHPFGGNEDSLSKTSSSRSLRPSHQSRVPLTEQAAQPGEVVEFPLIKYQHTNSSISAYNSLQRISAKEFTEGAAIPIDSLSRSVSAVSSRQFERPQSTLTDSQASQSQLDSISQVASTAPSTLQSQSTIRRPLPAPPHPPPSYDAPSAAPGPLSPLHALASHARNLALLEADPNSSVHSLSSAPPATPSITPQPFASMGSVVITEPTRIEYAYTVNDERSLHQPPVPAPAPSPPSVPLPKPETEPKASLDRFNRPAYPTTLPGSPTISAENDPFNTARYELPGWLSSDPFPARTLKHSTSQPSLYVATPRSTAASSRVLPSDSSIRTLTPEPTSPLPAEQELPSITSPVLSTRPSSTVTSVLVRGPLEGQGPPLEEMLVQNAAERPGWGKVGSPLAHSGSRKRAPVDRFEANESHPSRRRSGLASPPITAGTDMNGSGTRQSTFLSLTPLSDGVAGPGLSRAFSIDSPRKPAAARVYHSSALSRDRSLLASPPYVPDRPSSNLSGSRPPLSAYADLGWDLAPGSSASNRMMNGERKRSSLAASSAILPGDIDSIRSMSPEVGWIPTGESLDGHQVLPASDKTEATAPTIPETNRISRLSIGEGAILWGRLTSVMEAQGSPSKEASK